MKLHFARFFSQLNAWCSGNEEAWDSKTRSKTARNASQTRAGQSVPEQIAPRFHGVPLRADAQATSV
eukprot:7426921-Alexandrium_andersonii.AAC.1